MKKLIYIFISIAAVLLILVWTGKKSVHHEILINASSENVWNILVDMDEYPEWNPVMKLLDGNVKEGQKVIYQFTQDESNVSKIGAQVVQVAPNALLNQKGGIPLVLTFNHKYELEDLGSSTKVTIHEDYRGIGVNFWNPKPVEEAYARINEALKAKAEQNLN